MLSWLRKNKRFVLGLILLFIARGSVADHYVVPSGSMEYTLIPGDRVLVDKLAYGVHLPFTQIKLTQGTSPERGDIVIFDAPDSGVRLIKRVVAVGGDRLEVRGGHVIINGRPLALDDSLAEQFRGTRSRLNLNFGGGPDVAPLLVPPGHVFVLGDARGNSRDSRWFGLVPQSALYAKALGVYYRSGQGITWLAL